MNRSIKTIFNQKTVPQHNTQHDNNNEALSIMTLSITIKNSTPSIILCQVENVSQSIWIIDCNLTIWLIESKYLKMTKAIGIIEF
jgi:hypothetical protein